MPFTYIIPDVGSKPNAARMADGVALQTRLANCEVRLFTTEMGALTDNTTLADLDANQATFDGYVEDGNTIAAFGDPFVDPEGEGVLIVAPTTQFNYTAPGEGEPVTETIKGFYVVTAGGALVDAVEFDDPVPMASNSDSIPIVLAFRV